MIVLLKQHKEREKKMGQGSSGIERKRSVKEEQEEEGTGVGGIRLQGGKEEGKEEEVDGGGWGRGTERR